MHIQFSSLGLALAVIARGAIIPRDTPNGVYRSYTNERGGIEVNERLNLVPVDTRSTAAAPLLQARQGSFLHCGCGFYLNHGDCDSAVADLSNQLNGSGGVGANIAYYSIRGSVVAFICNGTPQRIYIDGQDYGQRLAIITEECGLYTAGTWSDGANYGYMQYYDGLDFCGNALASSQQICI